MRRLTNIIEHWILDAILQYGGDEDIIWDTGITAFPDPTAEVDDSEQIGMVPALVLYVEIPMGEKMSIYGSAILVPSNLDEATINLAVKLTLERLRKARNEKLQTIS